MESVFFYDSELFEQQHFIKLLQNLSKDLIIETELRLKYVYKVLNYLSKNVYIYIYLNNGLCFLISFHFVCITFIVSSSVIPGKPFTHLMPCLFSFTPVSILSIDEISLCCIHALEISARENNYFSPTVLVKVLTY